MRLDGVDGRHLLGFMTALGALVLLDRRSRSTRSGVPRLKFAGDGTAEISGVDMDPNTLVDVLFEELQPLSLFLNKQFADLDRPSDFSRESFERVANACSRWEANLLSGLACCVENEGEPSTLCAANGAGHQNLFRSMRDVLTLLEKEHLHGVLFSPWKYQYRVPEDRRKQLKLGARKPTLRLDPSDDRLYALRLMNPTTTDDFQTELGAQALATPAFSVLSVVPRTPQPLAVASHKLKNKAWFLWPLWQLSADPATVRTLISASSQKRHDLESRGVFAVFSAVRVSAGKGRFSFMPSEGVWWADPDAAVGSDR